MDTIRTTKDLLMCNGSAQPVMVALMPNEIALIALAPDMAAALIEAEKALALHQAWSDSEDAGPDYGDQTRDTHPDGERIWRQWWEGNLSLCDRAQEATRAALATIRKVTA
ncbi:MAG: hypothetical protein IT555_21935 [Acetobacteraceae bacterium]|nr:hypothetical protein [Acetobacteraceae bacterium]